MILRGSVYSKTLEMETGISILTPRSREDDSPVKTAYLLHGLSANCHCWLDCTMLPVYAKNLDAVFVMPEVGRSFYSDMKHGQRFFSYVADELPEICARLFRLSGKREDTAVIGGSMGGYGALKVALSRPERFGICCALSSGCLYLEERIQDLGRVNSLDVIREYLGDQLVRDFQAITGGGFTIGEEHRVLTLARAVAEKMRPRIYSVCGTEDELIGENRRFRDDMRGLGYDFTYDEWRGGHDWYFFDAALRKALDFWLGGV